MAKIAGQPPEAIMLATLEQLALRREEIDRDIATMARAASNEGASNAEIARAIGVSKETVRRMLARESST